MDGKLRISLEAARVNAGMTQPQAAQALGISVATLLKWEKGTTVPPVDKAEKLVNMYGLQLDDVNFCRKS